MCKVWFVSFEKFGCGVNRATMEREWKWSASEFWAILGETLNVCSELVRKVVHLWVVGVGYKIGH